MTLTIFVYNPFHAKHTNCVPTSAVSPHIQHKRPEAAKVSVAHDRYLLDRRSFDGEL